MTANYSRPPSHVFPVFHSSLSYTSVRDFAYPALHPLHYGPPPEPPVVPSGLSTPASEQRRLSDPPRASWEGSRGNWSAGPWGGDGVVNDGQIFEDGPPWSEDDDLHSPVVVSSRHRKHKSSTAIGDGPTKAKGGHGDESSGRFSAPKLGEYESGRGYYTGTNRDGSETYYHYHEGETADGPGGEYITYPPDQSHRPGLYPYNVPSQRDSHFAARLPNRSYVNPSGESFDPDEESSPSSPILHRDDESRYSRDYQFTIASPDEEMHGKAVALFDFKRENENELPLVEGQVIWVSYRHGQGWLVAEDPKTQESGLVPEEYVRLLRDIRGGVGFLNGDPADALLSPQSTTSEFGMHELSGHGYHGSNGSNSYQHPPIVSTFSTSSKDLHPYPPHLLGTQYGQTPPQVIHYQGQRGGSQSQSATPTMTTPLAERLCNEELGPSQTIEEEANGDTQCTEKGKAADREGKVEETTR
ncbi:MAG: HOG (high osmolarity glycerol) pathway protein [Geoglossum umbratile]|nr:MAG: HOG (high osmolarity glycerol) pathway protein [Geoglossum umbratile]